MTREDKLFKDIDRGDRSAVGQLIEMYYSDILRYCLWHVPNRELAEDATQETFLKAMRYFDSYTHKGKFRAFLYKIASNTCIDMQRRKQEGSLDDLEDEQAYFEKGFEKIDVDSHFMSLIHSLPEEQREIVILRFSQDLKIREIAEITGNNLRTVQSRLRAALKKLKKEVEKGVDHDE